MKEFGRYQLHDLVGRGGAGEVWRAFDTERERFVALKLLPESVADDAQFRERFRRESAVVARLRDPHVIPIHDYGEIDGRLFLDMRLVEGEDLGQILAREGALDAGRAVGVLSQVASALDAAHLEGIVHRDVKPSNVLIAGAGQTRAEEFVYLADFGVAAAIGGTSMTQTGAVVGSIAYIAPERIAGDTISQQSDVYSLACLFYETLTGEQPFPTEDFIATLQAHMNRPPPRPSAVVAGLPALLDQVVAYGMAKDGAGRYQTAGALASAARAALLGTLETPSGADGLVLPDPRPEPGQSGPSEGGFGTTGPPPAAVSPRSRPGDDTTVLRPRLAPAVLVPRPVPPRTGGPAAFPQAAQLQVQLHPAFRYVASPELPADGPIPFLDNEVSVDLLRNRICWSDGGAILVTGFSGVGKTTVVNRALAGVRTELAAAEGESQPLIEVRLDVARPVSPDELMIKMIRNVVEAARDSGILARLAGPVRSEMDLAYRRTSQSLKEIRARTTEASAEFGLAGLAALGPLAAPTGKLGGKRTNTSTSEAGFLTYTMADAEHDLSRILRALCLRDTPRPTPWWAPWRSRPWAGRVVVILDELDKLTAAAEGWAALTNLITALKNVFSTAGAHFVFVAGPDVLDEVLAASRRGSAIYDGVFAMQRYVPCVSTGAGRVVVRRVAEYGGEAVDVVADYLDYRGRGLPRLLLSGLNDLVGYTGRTPILTIGPEQATSVAFFAGLHRRLANLRPPEQGPLSHPVDSDRYRMGAHLLTDWALGQGSRTFTASDLAAADDRPDRFVLPPVLVPSLLEQLASRPVGILERRVVDRADRTLLDVGAAQPEERVYALAADVLYVATGARKAPEDLGRIADRYALLDELGRGGLGRTYLARDERSGAMVVVKLLDTPSLARDDLARRRFQREAELLLRLRHPALVPAREVFEDEGVLGIVLDHVDGEPLERVITAPQTAEAVVALGRHLVDLLGYLAGQDVVRLDLKPANVVLDGHGLPVVIDLGLARRLERGDGDQLTSVGAILGTPRYAAPEQLRGEPVDVRADLYSLGLILIEALTGTPARAGHGTAVLQAARRSSGIVVDRLPCSSALKAVLATLTAPDPSERYDSPDAVAAALAATPEAQDQVEQPG
jgi:serine/threonine-protein kinase